MSAVPALQDPSAATPAVAEPSRLGATTPRNVSIAYAVIACVWILFSDRVLATLALPPQQWLAASQYKGWAFVVVTAALLYWVLRRWQARFGRAVGELAESEQKYRTLFDSSPEPLWMFDWETLRFLAVNRVAIERYGYSREEFLAMTIKGIRGPEELPELEPALRADPLKLQRLHHRTKDGRRLTVEVSSTPLRFAGRPARLVFAHDISRRVRDEQYMRLTALAFARTHEAIAITDAAGNILTSNPAFTQLTGYTADEMEGKIPLPLLIDRNDATFSGLQQALTTGSQWDGEVFTRRKDGERSLVSVSVHPAHGEDGQLTHFVAVGRDISAERAAEARIEHLAYFDSLTGLPNRNHLEAQARAVIGRHQESGEQFALLFLDIDHFKTINDSLGHLAGDSLLRTLAQRIQGEVRATDTTARWGGDEFVVLVNEVTPELATDTVQRILRAVEKPVRVHGRLMTSGASAGVALYPRDGVDFAELLQAAGTAMHRAKELGRSSFQFFRRELNQEACERMTLASTIRQALANDEMVVHYQPQLNLGTGQVVGFEALLRWQHPELGIVGPDKFIKVAEDNGFMPILGRWVLEQACAQLKELPALGLPHVRMAVNVSAVQLRDATFADECLRVVRQAGVAPTLLELEVTESGLLEDKQLVLGQFKQLQAHGIGVSLDDFGIGYSSLTYLHALGVDNIKIDRSFVSQMLTDPAAQSIVQAIISLGHALGLRVIAEGVETAAQAEALARLGCDDAQGYVFSRPLPPAELTAWVRQFSTGSDGKPRLVTSGTARTMSPRAAVVNDQPGTR